MKKSTLILLLSFIIPLSGFAQGEIAKITADRWNVEKNAWDFQTKETWDYNQDDLAVLYTYKDAFFSDYIPYNNRRVESSYDDQGNLIQQKDRSWSEGGWEGSWEGWYEILTTNTYNDQLALTESIAQNTYSDNDYVSFQRHIYEHDAAENRYTYKYYADTEMPNAWRLQHKRDSFYDADGCLKKTTLVTYNENEEEANVNWEIRNYDQGCQLSGYENWRYQPTGDSMQMINRLNYEYSADGRIERQYYERFESANNEWKLIYIFETEVDEDGRNIRYFRERITSDYRDTTLRLNVYTSKGEIANYKEYQSFHQYENNLEPELANLRLIRFDDFTYHYDELKRLIKKENFLEHYDAQYYSFTDYEYYCNDQLKRETSTQEGVLASRITYEYHSDTGCGLEAEESAQMEVFPNPSTGSFVIESNLLSDKNALVRIFTTSGQEVYTRNMNRLTEEHRMEISAVPLGRYVVTITTKEETISEIVVVN